jgi:succinyl-CoA synthetase beta subunit
MLSEKMAAILSDSRETGWVLEPEAKRLFSMAGIDVPKFTWAKSEEEALQFAERIGYPVVAKVVSPKVIHKTERGGVIVGVDHGGKLAESFRRLSRIEGFQGILVEEMVEGLELIVGAKRDHQFGAVILLGMGGTGVEIYRDVTLRMAPLRLQDAESMMKCLRAGKVLDGYRGKGPVNKPKLAQFLITFSELVMDLQEEIESIDLNPVFCSSDRCIVGDARIMLNPKK